MDRATCPSFATEHPTISNLGTNWQLKPCSPDDIIDITMDGLFFLDMFLCCNEAFTVDGPDGAYTL